MTVIEGRRIRRHALSGSPEGCLPKTYDLSNKRDRALVYEQVLAEGTDEDIRYFIEIPELIDLWEELFLPAHVRLRWAAWLKKNQNIDLA